MHRGELRRKDREMTAEESWSLLAGAYCGRLGTSDAEGWPYVVPKMFVVVDGKIYFHSSQSRGHTRSSVEANPRVCFEVDEPGPVFPSGEDSLCNTSNGFESVITFGTCRLVEDEEHKAKVLYALMAKYADPAWERPDSFPMLAVTAVFEITVERITGKRRPVAVTPRWQHLFPAP
ncbi:MAG TPA: pyridoxamine 5'-phosphate oxidase family protein [Symbiobacteriaceae bacterium]|nr:pyridoxamine 5'-phosphate oxidase family protein [Symbiobacteriaceae bacterium]